MRFIYKTFRIFHVSFFFYFAPFLMLVYQFFLSPDDFVDKKLINPLDVKLKHTKS